MDKQLLISIFFGICTGIFAFFYGLQYADIDPIFKLVISAIVAIALCTGLYFFLMRFVINQIKTLPGQFQKYLLIGISITAIIFPVTLPLDLSPVLNSTNSPAASFIWGALAILSMVSCSFLTLLLLSLLVLKPTTLDKIQDSTENRWAWLQYSLPMIGVWSFFLLVFWPGIMTADSIDQWGQMVAGRFSDWHPAFHTFVIWLTTRLWYSPALLAILQICALSLAIAWSLSVLRKVGLPNSAAWVISFVFAISPVNSTFVITLWKDILYSVSFYILAIIILQMVISNGNWINRRAAWIGTGTLCAFVTLFRHNGFPVALVTLAALLWFYRKNAARRIIYAAMVYILIWFGVTGPLYNALKVYSPDYVSSTLLIHHIAAQLNAGTEFTEQELQFLNTLRPLDDKWDYSCYYADPTIFSPKFNWDLANQNKQQIQLIFLKTLKRNPLATLRHVLCSGSMVWRITQPVDGPLNTFSIWKDTQIHTIVPNQLGLETKSVFPELMPYLYDWLVNTRYPLVWRPAIYLYLTLFLTFILAIKFRNWRYLIFFIPMVVQSGILLVVGYAQDVRYQYAVYLLGLFCLSFIFVSVNHKE